MDQAKLEAEVARIQKYLETQKDYLEKEIQRVMQK